MLQTRIGRSHKNEFRPLPGPSIRELQADERLDFERRSWNKIKRRMFPLLKSLSIPVQRRFIKTNRRVRLTEALTAQFIAGHTTIPVPRILDVFKYNDRVHIVQEFIDAPMLLSVWHKLALEDRKRCMIQLRGYIDQLHALLPPEPGKVQAVDGLGFRDDRVGEGDYWGPFESHDAFHQFFHHEQIRQHPHQYPEGQAPLAAIKGRVWRTVFAHGDLGPHNILWDVKKREIAAIIDWEFGGWFPEYWDYIRVYFGPGAMVRTWSWWEMFQEYNKCYKDELEVEMVLANYFSRYI